MKYVICVLFAFFCYSCNKKGVDYTCNYVEMQDNYPKLYNDLDYGREICCVLKFHNTGRDSIFLPFYRIGVMRYKSWFYVKYKNQISKCPASFWGPQVSTFVVAPDECVRIGLIISPGILSKLSIKQDVDIKDLSKMISIHYRYAPTDSAFNHLKTPLLEIKRDSIIKLTYSAIFFTSH